MKLQNNTKSTEIKLYRVKEGGVKGIFMFFIFFLSKMAVS